LSLVNAEQSGHTKKVYLIAGEASGDLHGSNLMRELKEMNNAIEFRFWGGDLMEEQGGTLVSHYKDRAVMGILEVLKNIRTFKKWIQQCKDDLQSYQPDILVLIDYGGFNLRIAKYAKSIGLEVHYYIPPKVWAWNEKRVHKIKKYTDKVYVILPFEAKYYQKHAINCSYVGNPIMDELEQKKSQLVGDKKELATHIALLPGSRKQEIKYNLPVMLAYAESKPESSFLLAVSDPMAELIATYSIPKNVKLVQGRTYQVLHHSYVALVTSGTANLETAIINTPQVVVYRGAWLTYILAKIFIKVKHLSPVNLIAGKRVVAELIQHQFNVRRVSKEMEAAGSGPKREMILAAYKKIQAEIGEGGCSKRVATEITKALEH